MGDNDLDLMFVLLENYCLDITPRKADVWTSNLPNYFAVCLGRKLELKRFAGAAVLTCNGLNFTCC